MFGDALNWYLTSMAEFWGSAFRIGLPQILLIILLICWLRRKGGARSRGKGCCWMWCCERDDGEDESDWSDRKGDRGSSGDRCRREQAGDTGGDDGGGDDE